MIRHAPIVDPGVIVVLEFCESHLAFFTDGFFYGLVRPRRSICASRNTNNMAERDRRLRVFVQEVTLALLAGQCYRAPGLGTFSPCTRQTAPGRPSSTMAIFRASAELRGYASGGPLPNLSGPHARALRTIADGMQSESGITIPLLGRMAVVSVPGGRPKLIFHGAKELNERFGAS